MSKKSIALVVDSCTDVPQSYIDAYGIFVIPITIHYSFGSFLDGIEISAEEVYERLPQEIPTTSLPGGDMVADTFSRIVAAGYEKALVITISSGLSGTHQMLRLAARDYPELDCRFIDTKNIGIGAGLTAILAGQWIADGMDLDTIETNLKRSVADTKVFFCLPTLEYLKKGGRIGPVAAVLGSALGLKPVITCNGEGTYETVKKTRGWRKSLQAAIDLASNFVAGHPFRLAVAHGGAKEEGQRIFEQCRRSFLGYDKSFFGQISPALVVHTGPGLIGIGVQRLEKKK